MFMQPSTRAWITDPEAGFSGDSPIDNGEPDRQATPPNAYDYADPARMIWRKGNPWPQQLMTALALLACFLHDSPAHLIRHGQPNQAEARARA